MLLKIGFAVAAVIVFWFLVWKVLKRFLDNQ